jgi:hypothetical protein
MYSGRVNVAQEAMRLNEDDRYTFAGRWASFCVLS